MILSRKSGISIYIITGLYDLEYQNTTSIVSASWHGFIDFESFIHHYEWCVGNTNASDECDVMEYTSVGLQTSAARESHTPLQNGLY